MLNHLVSLAIVETLTLQVHVHPILLGLPQTFTEEGGLLQRVSLGVVNAILVFKTHEPWVVEACAFPTGGGLHAGVGPSLRSIEEVFLVELS